MRIQLRDLTREIFPTQLFDIIFPNSMIERSNMYQIMHTELEQEMPQKCHENSKNVIHHYFKKSEKKEETFQIINVLITFFHES